MFNMSLLAGACRTQNAGMMQGPRICIRDCSQCSSRQVSSAICARKHEGSCMLIAGRRRLLGGVSLGRITGNCLIATFSRRPRDSNSVAKSVGHWPPAKGCPDVQWQSHISAQQAQFTTA